MMVRVQKLRSAIHTAVLWWAQRQAERLAFQQRRATLRQDIDLDKTGL